MLHLRRAGFGTVLATTLVTWVQGPEDLAQGEPLVLKQVASWTLPGDFGLGGVAFVPTDQTAAIAWSHQRPQLALLGPAGLVRAWPIPGVAGGILAAATVSADTIEALTTEPFGVYTLSVRDSSSSFRPIPGAAVPVAAAFTGGAWVVVVEDLDDGIQLRRLGDPEYRRLDSYPVLFATATDIYATSVLAPFATEVFESTTFARQWHIRPPSDLLDSLLQSPGEAAVPQWRSLPVLPLDQGFLQTISDQHSDRRAIMHYGAGGEVLSSKIVDVAIAFVASDPRRNRVVGGLSTDRAEVVEYEVCRESC